MKLLSTQAWDFLVIVRGMLHITLGVTPDLDWNFQASTLVVFFFKLYLNEICSLALVGELLSFFPCKLACGLMFKR